jgi:hypothetical protein
MTNNIRERLAMPFPEKDIEWRIQQAGFSGDKPWAMVLAYIDARAIMDRLDDVFGIDGWSDEYDHLDGGVMCTLTVRLSERDYISKQDGSPETNMEAFKGGISKALVRTAVKFGIGRYLYNLEVNFANCSVAKQQGWRKHYDKASGKTFYWQPPSLPKWALPPNEIEAVLNEIRDHYKVIVKDKGPKWFENSFGMEPVELPKQPLPILVDILNRLRPDSNPPGLSEIDADFPIPPGESVIGSPEYRIQNAKYRGKQLKNISEEELTAYYDVLESRIKKGSAKDWEHEVFSSIGEYLAERERI